MKYFKIVFSFLLLIALISCGGRNESKENNKDETDTTETSKIVPDTLDVETPKDTTTINSTNENYNTSTDSINNTKNSNKNNIDKKSSKTITSPAAKKAEAVINSPLRNLLNNAQVGKTYTKSELIELYKFPKEAVDLIKHVTYVGQNRLYFKWGSTWIVEKVSDAKFKNDTMIIAFKQNKTYVSGGAIGIKYNKKIYTELILNNGSAYIPSVKGYHWDIGK
jgi:hypothetical protein